MQEGDATQKPVVLITGSSGLIGSALVDALSADYTVVGFDIVRPPEPSPRAEWIVCDMTKDDSVDGALAAVRDKHGDRIASVLHLAAYYDFSGEPSELYEKLTIQGTRRLLRALRKMQVEQFVFSSTLLLMQPVEPGERLTEASPLAAEWDYPQSKLAAEQVIAAERDDIPAVVLRIAGVYDDDCHSIPIAQQIRRIYERSLESYFFPGNASHGQSFVHLEDLVDCFRRVVERRHELSGHEVFLVGEPDTMSYAELQDRIGELIHRQQWTTIRIPKAVAKVGAWAQEKFVGEEETFIKPWMIDLADAHYPVDITKARDRLGWQPKHTLRDSLDVMISRLQEDPLRWYEVNKLSHED